MFLIWLYNCRCKPIWTDSCSRESIHLSLFSPPESVADSDSKFFPSSWPFATTYLPIVRDFFHKVASKLEDDTASAMNKLHGWDGERVG